MHMKNFFTGSMIAMAFASLTLSPIAQERSAGGPVDTQMTWSALASLVNAANAKSDAVNSRVDQVVVCAKKGKVYAPGQAGVDGQGCLNATVDLTAVHTLITNLTNNLAATTSIVNSVVVCNNKGLTYAPAATGRDAQNCIKTDGGMDVGTVTTSINGANGFAPNTVLTAKSDIFVSASSYGGGGESCPVSGEVNGVRVANDYAIRYASSVSFMVPKGAKWQVVAAGGNCSNRQVNVSVLPLN